MTVFWGIRVVVPKKLQNRVLEEQHQTHLGITKTKSLACSHVWWSKLDYIIESSPVLAVKPYSLCQLLLHFILGSGLHCSHPWQRVHIDFAGHFCNRNFLIVVDAHSKWPEVIPMATTTSTATIHELRHLCILPEQLVSDNSPQLVSDEFQKFLKKNRVKHLHSAPYHPSSNGLAERFVGTLK